MEKKLIQEAEDQLKRALLMMKYDSSKTLTENKETNHLLSEKSRIIEMHSSATKKMYLVEDQKPYSYTPPGTSDTAFAEKPFSLTQKEQGTAAAAFLTPEEYAKSGESYPNESLKCSELERDQLIKMGYSLEESETLKDMVTRDEGLVDTLDADTSMIGFSMDTDDCYNAANAIKARENRLSRYKEFYYPSIEILRSFYSEDESGDALYDDLIDPPGSNTEKVLSILGPAAKTMISIYQKWLDDLKKVRGGTENKCKEGEIWNETKQMCEPAKKGGEVLPPKPVVDRYRYCEGTSDKPFEKGCIEKELDGPIHKVQSCLGGLVSDGKFWTKTEAALFSKTKKKKFTKDEVSTICSQSAQPAPEEPTAEGPKPEQNQDDWVN